MKHLFIFAALLFCIATARAQGNLQFNQVIAYNLANGSPQAFTVPAGKVWKVESVGILSASANIYLRSNVGTQICVLTSTNSSNYPYFNTVFPFWLPENYSGQFYAAGTTGFVSIIEFNVIP